MRRKKVIYLSALLCVGVLQWASFFQSEVFTWDAAFYLAAARSLVFDHDLRLSNDLALSYRTASPDFEAKEYHNQFIHQDRVYNPFAIGTSFAWVPWFRMVKLGYDIVGLQTDGFEWPYRIGAATISLVLGWATFAIGFSIATRDTAKSWSFWATLTALFATPLLYYLYHEPGYSHAISALVAGVVVLVWLLSKGSVSLISGFALGLLIGIAALVRWQHAVYLLLPAYSGFRALSKTEVDLQTFGGYGLLVALGFFVGLSPQLVIWQLSTGSWFTVPQGDSFMVWLPLYLPQFLFSTYRGVLAWMPLLFPALFGLIISARRHPNRYLPLILVLAAQIYVNASTPDWMGCGGYGPRRLSSELVILILGYSAFLGWLSKHSSLLPHVLNSTIVAHQLVLFRFGLAEALGGRAIAKIADTYLVVEATAWPEFVRTLLNHLPRLFPPTTLISPDAFIATATHDLRAWASLALLAVFIGLGVLLVQLVRRLFQQHSRRFLVVMASGVSVFILILNIWLITYA